MKEAAGEANMTVITIVLIAIVLAVGTILVNSMMKSSGESSACSSAGGTWQGGKCYRSETCTLNATNGKTDCNGGTQLSCGKDTTSGNWTCSN